MTKATTQSQTNRKARAASSSPASGFVRDLETGTKLKRAKDAAIGALQAIRSRAKDHLEAVRALQRDPSAKFMHDLAEEPPPKDIKNLKAASNVKAKSAPQRGSPTARLQKAAKQAGFEAGLEALAHKQDSEKPTIGGTPSKKASKRAKDEGDLSQAEKF